MTSLTVDGSPSGCRQAADGLRMLRARLTTLADQLAATRAASAASWSGLAGERFRGRLRTLVSAADQQATVIGALAPALDSLADRLDGVRATMQAARAIALGAGIPVLGDELPPAAGLPPEQARAHARAVALVDRARAREGELQQDWADALAAIPTPAWTDGADHPVLDAVGRLDGLVEPVQVRPLPDLVRDLVTGQSGGDAPRLPSVAPLLPLLPLLRQGGDGGSTGLGLVVKQLERVGTEVWEQMDEDTDREGLSLRERLARGVLMGTTTGLGALGGIALCVRLGVSRAALPACGEVGAVAGEKGGDLVLEAIDGR
jgi:hypothetical protein